MARNADAPGRAEGRIGGGLGRARARVREMDWRIKVILIAFASSVAVSLLIYALGFGRSPSTFFGAVFASWVGGVALFAVVGAAAAVVSLARPEQEAFDARARILFRRQSGGHIEYIVQRIAQILEHYSERHIEKYEILDYDENSNRFRVGSETDVSLRSYIDDIQSDFKAKIRYDGITSPPPGGAPTKLCYVRVDGRPVMPPKVINGADMDEEIETRIDRDAVCRIEHRVELWIAAETEENTFWPVRYTQHLRLEAENCIDRNVLVRLSRDGAPPQEHLLEPGASRSLASFSDLRPGTRVYDLRILLA